MYVLPCSPASSLIKAQDHFYACPGHLKDKGFCTPIIDEAEAAAKRKKEALDREVELIKQEYEEKMKKRKKGKEEKKKEKDEKNKESNDKDYEKIERERDDKVSANKAYVGNGC